MGSRLLLSYLCIAQMGCVEIELAEDQMLVLASARRITQSLFAIRKSHLLWQTRFDLTRLKLYPLATAWDPKKLYQGQARRASAAPGGAERRQSMMLAGSSSRRKSRGGKSDLDREEESIPWIEDRPDVCMLPSQLVLRVLAPRPGLSCFQYIDANPYPAPYKVLGMKFRKHARRIFVAMSVAKRLRVGSSSRGVSHYFFTLNPKD